MDNLEPRRIVSDAKCGGVCRLKKKCPEGDSPDDCRTWASSSSAQRKQDQADYPLQWRISACHCLLLMLCLVVIYIFYIVLCCTDVSSF